MPHGRRQASEEGIDRGAVPALDARFGRCGHRIIIRRETVDLIDVEHRVRAQEPDILRRRLAGDAVRLGFREGRIIDAVRAMLAAPYLSAQLGRLSVGHPVAAREPLGVADRPEIERVDAGVGRAAMPQRSPPCPGQSPGARPGQDAGFKLGDYEVGDLGRDIAAWRSRFAVKGHGKAPSMRGPRVTVRG